MHINTSYIKMFIALITGFTFYFFLYQEAASERIVHNYGFGQYLVEVFLSSLLYYGTFFIGKVYIYYWFFIEGVGVFEKIVRLFFENIYLPFVSLLFPIIIAQLLFEFTIPAPVVWEHKYFVILQILILMDPNGNLRIHIYEQNNQIRNRSLAKFGDLISRDNNIIRRINIMHFFIIYVVLGIIAIRTII